MLPFRHGFKLEGVLVDQELIFNGLPIVPKKKNFAICDIFGYFQSITHMKMTQNRRNEHICHF